MPQQAKALAAFIAALCAVLGLSCGGDEKPRAATTGRATPRVNVLTDDDVKRFRRDSPERALVEWFQAVQFRDVDTARVLVSQSAYAQLGSRRFSASVKRVGRFLGRPEIVGNRRLSGDRHNVRVLIQSYDGVSARPKFSTPASFVMVDQNGWRLENLDYLVEANQSLIDERRRRPERR